MSTEDQMKPIYSNENEYGNIDNKLESFAIPEILSPILDVQTVEV